MSELSVEATHTKRFECLSSPLSIPGRLLHTIKQQVKYFPRVATEYLEHFAATPALVPFLKVRLRTTYMV